MTIAAVAENYYMQSHSLQTGKSDSLFVDYTKQIFTPSKFIMIDQLFCIVWQLTSKYLREQEIARYNTRD